MPTAGKWIAPLLTAITASGLFAQTPPSEIPPGTVPPAAPAAAFEVASIREETAPFRTMRAFSISGTRITMQVYGVGWLVAEAFGLRDYQVAADSIPRASQGVYYSIDARATGQSAPSRAEVRTMLQALLAERFHLTFHREMRKMPFYALVVDKNGPRLKPGTGDVDCLPRIGPVIPTDRNYRYQFVNCPLDRLADSLGADRPILNRTDLAGNYDISIFVTPEFRMRDTTEIGDVTFRDAVRPLGLRLDAVDAPIEVVVIDHFDATPTPN
jgi:uncharacterized protein (TIGR03435 family)